jgi:UDPglucose 6-dehydrogenase
MKLCVIGTGYVGLVAGACFADTGNNVICVDKDQEKIEMLLRGEIPIYEPGLATIVERNTKAGRLVFTTDLAKGVNNSEVCFIAVGTPQDEDGSADLSHVCAVAEEIGKVMDGYRIIVNKSTVPVGTADKVSEVIASQTTHPFDVVSNPEFLKEGDAINDFVKPDRVVIGTESEKVQEVMRRLYSPFNRTNNRVIFMDVRSAEMTKYAANCLLATKISFINEMANLCERLGADVSNVRIGIGSDSRIGYKFLYPGVGYGGSCFPKDVQALIHFSEEAGYFPEIIHAVQNVNKRQKAVLANKILTHFNNNIAGKKIALWGLSFKPNTDDMREAPALTIIKILLLAGAEIHAFDPIATDRAKEILGDTVTLHNDMYTPLEHADCLAVVTEWPQFRNPDFAKIKETMIEPTIFDGRNLYRNFNLADLGFAYYPIGKTN